MLNSVRVEPLKSVYRFGYITKKYTPKTIRKRKGILIETRAVFLKLMDIYFRNWFKVL